MAGTFDLFPLAFAILYLFLAMSVLLYQVHTLLKGLEKIAASADIPMLVCGDFNSTPGRFVSVTDAFGVVCSFFHRAAILTVKLTFYNFNAVLLTLFLLWGKLIQCIRI